MGCGWLGFPLAKSLVDAKYEVYGSTTSEAKIAELQQSGITPFLIRLGEKRIEGNVEAFFSDADIGIINVPPGLRRSPAANYVDKLKLLRTALIAAGVKKVVFVSSISVYGNVQGEVDEHITAAPATESGRQLLEVENLMLSTTEFETAVIRFGGLIGPGRHPVRMLSGRTDLKNGNDPINLIHLEDCIYLIETVIENNWWGEIFNGVYPLHPSKKDYYQSEAERLKLSPPSYTEGSSMGGKQVNSANFFGRGYKFRRSP